MEEALVAHLLASLGVTALVGTRVRYSVAKQDDAAPRIVMHTISREPVYHTGGQSDLADARVQIDSWATTALGALAVARAVKLAIPKRPFTRNGINFHAMLQLSERADFFGDTPTARLHRVSIDFRVWHSSP